MENDISFSQQRVNTAPSTSSTSSTPSMPFAKEGIAKPTMDIKQAFCVLLAEDNNILARALTLQLKKLGCQVDWVANGQDAVEAASIKDYDLMFLDNRMPIMNGIPAAIKIKGLPNVKANTPIVILTGGLEQEDQDKCKNAGISQVLVKPARMQELEQVLTLAKSA